MMRIFGLGDLHLSLCRPVVPGEWQHIGEHKPMAIFGDHWAGHVEKIYREWTDTVTGDDVVLVPGDISWAMTIRDACHDFAFLDLLPGKIMMVQGNHDYWWQGIGRVRQALPRHVRAIQNDGVLLGDVYVCGTRGWLCPNSAGFSPHDEKIYQRELQRLELSLKTVDHKARKIIVMMHFMPTNDLHEPSGFIRLMKQYGVEQCVYGHLHQGAFHLRLPEIKWGIKFDLTSADYLGFRPKLL